ncbi:MAG: hypothetical protein ACYCU7_00155 [Acidimicrobiales bacterium]
MTDGRATSSGPPPACGEDHSMPTCATGPAGRLRFVLRELAGQFRRAERDAP